MHLKKTTRRHHQTVHNEYGIRKYMRESLGLKLQDQGYLARVFDFCMQNPRLHIKILDYDNIPKGQRSYTREACYRYTQKNFHKFARFMKRQLLLINKSD